MHVVKQDGKNVFVFIVQPVLKHLQVQLFQ
jgi:hypothetical protein